MNKMLEKEWVLEFIIKGLFDFVESLAVPPSQGALGKLSIMM